MLKMSVSPETSSQNGDVEIGRETFGSSKMGLSPETSSKNGDVEIAVFGHVLKVFSEDPHDGPRGKIFQKQLVFQRL